MIARDRILDWQRVNNGRPREQVERLDLSSLGLRRVPDALALLTNLTAVDLGGNGLTELPTPFWNMTNLEVVSLADNPLETLSSDIGGLGHLTSLSLQRCGLRELPEQIGDLANLEVLNVTGNPLTRLPASFNRLQNLQNFAARSTGLDLLALVDFSFPHTREFEFYQFVPSVEPIGARPIDIGPLVAPAAQQGPGLAQTPILEAVDALDGLRVHLQPAARDIEPAAGPTHLWHRRLLGLARRQPAEVGLALSLAASELVTQMNTDPGLSTRCVAIIRYAGDSDTGVLIALNEMHEAAMAARCGQAGVDAGTLIELSADLFVLGEVKTAALAFAAPTRAAGQRDEASAIQLARQSVLCARLERMVIRAPLPTRSVPFNRADDPPDGQMERELRLLRTLQDGTALRRHLIITPQVTCHVETTQAYVRVRDSFHDDLQRLGDRAEMPTPAPTPEPPADLVYIGRDGSLYLGQQRMDEQALASVLPDDAPDAARQAHERLQQTYRRLIDANTPLDEGTYLRCIEIVSRKQKNEAARELGRLVPEFVDSHLAALRNLPVRTEPQDLATQLNGWVNEPGVLDGERANRQEATRRILDWEQENRDRPAGHVSPLDLSSLRLRSLPDVIGQLRSLQVLKLKGNHLSTLPAGLFTLENLRELDLSLNRIETLPAALGQLSNLVELDISTNRLTTLPEELGNLTRLTRLRIQSNSHLAQLPDSIARLANLEGI